jgi:LPS-assembly protein
VRLKPTFALACCLLCHPVVSLFSQELQLESDQPIEFDEANKKMIATGEAALTYGDLILRANRIEYDQATGFADAIGNVRISQEGYRFLAERLKVNIQSQEVEATNVRFGSPPVYAEAESASGSNTRIELHNATVYYREPDKFTPRMKIENFVVEDGEIVNSEKVLFEILGLPVWYLPSLQVPTDVAPFRVRAKLGTRGNLGLFAQTQFLFPFTENWYAGGNLDIYTERGLLVGPAFRFLKETEESSSDWFISTGWIHDYGDRQADIFGERVPKDRYFIEGFLDQRWGSKQSLQGTYSLASDPEILRDLHFDDFYDNQQPDNFLEYRYQETDWAFSAFVRPDMNHFFSTDYLPFSTNPINRAFVFEEKLPEVRFDLHPNHIGGGFYHELALSASQIGHSFYLTDYREKESFTSLDGFYRIQKTTAFENGGSFNFFAGLRAIELKDVPTAVVEAEDGSIFRLPYPQYQPGIYASMPMDLLDVEEEDFSQLIGDIGFNLEGEFYRTWDTQNRTWKINGLKHVVKPYLQVRHNPTDKDYTPGMDSGLVYAQDTNLPNWDLATRRDAVFAQDQTLARIGVKNELHTKQKDYGSRQLLSWNLAGDYFFDGPFDDDISFVYSEIAASPAPWLEVGMFQRFSVDHLKLWEWNSRVRITDADVWYIEYRNSLAKLNQGFGYLGAPIFPKSGDLFPFLDVDQHSLEIGARINQNFRTR